MRTHGLAVVCLVLTVALDASLAAQTGPVKYVYDDLGRLVVVTNGNGESARYLYDSVGNLLGITRYSPTQVAIFHFSPPEGASGTSVTIDGSGFSDSPDLNTVQFNGAAALVTSASATRLVVTVPSAATTGTISMTSPAGTAVSSANFVVAAAGLPAITSFTPTIGVTGAAVTVTGSGFDPVLSRNRLGLNTSGAWPTAGTTTSLDALVPEATGTGRFSITTPFGSTTSAADFFVPPPPFVAGDVTATDRIAAGESRNVSISTSGKVGLIAFDGTAGQRLSLKVVPGPISTVTMYTPNLGQLVQTPITVWTGLVEPPLLPRTGTYSILLDPTGTATGTTGLTLYEVPPDVSGPIRADGTSTPVTTTVPGQNARLTFEGVSGQRVSLKLSAGSTGTVSIRAPDNSTVGSASIGVVPSFIDTRTLSAGGQHAVFTDYLNAGTGTLSLNLYTVPPDVTGTMTFGVGFAASLTVPGQNALLTFAGTAARRASVTVSSGPNGTVSLLTPDSTVLSTANSGPVYAFIEPQSLATTGTYTVKADPLTFNTGTLTLTVHDVPSDVTGTLVINDPAVPVSLSTPGQNASFTFAGTSGQQVTVRLTNNTMSTTTVRLLKPDGSQLTSSISAGGSFNLATQTLQSTGVYTVVIDPSKANVGGISVRVTNP